MARQVWDGFWGRNIGVTLTVPRNQMVMPGKWDDMSPGGNLYVFNAAPRFVGAPYLRYFAGAGDAYVVKTLAGNPNHLFFGFGFSADAFSVPTQPEIVFILYDGTTIQGTMTIEPDGSFAWRTGDITTSIVQKSTVLGWSYFYNWHEYEFELVIDNAAGVLNWWNEGTAIGAHSSQNTRVSGTSQATSLVVGTKGNSLVGTKPAVNLSDLYCVDSTGSAPLNARLGDVRVYGCTANGAGAFTQLTPTGSGTNWQNVDEKTTPNDANFNGTSTIGNKDLYTIDGIPTGFTGVIYGVAHMSRWSKDDAGPRTASQLLKSGSTTVTEAAVSLLTTFANQCSVYDTDPATSAAFANAAAVNALQIGAQLAA